MCVPKAVDGQDHLLEVVLTRQTRCCFANSHCRRAMQTDQHGNDGQDNEEFHQRECEAAAEQACVLKMRYVERRSLGVPRGDSIRAEQNKMSTAEFAARPNGVRPADGWGGGM